VWIGGGDGGGGSGGEGRGIAAIDMVDQRTNGIARACRVPPGRKEVRREREESVNGLTCGGARPPPHAGATLHVDGYAVWCLLRTQVLPRVRTNGRGVEVGFEEERLDSHAQTEGLVKGRQARVAQGLLHACGSTRHNERVGHC